jgi:glucokinase
MVVLNNEVLYVHEIDYGHPFFLAADIGGTNSNFGIFSLHNARPVLTLSLHYKSELVTDFTALIVQVVTYCREQYKISFIRGCIGAAGIVYPHRIVAIPTNLKHVEININDIKKATGIQDFFLINDFEAVALGVELLEEKDFFIINKGVHYLHSNQGFLGAGTGLGKSMMVWQRQEKRYMPVPSEGGHADAVFIGEPEQALEKYIHDEYSICPISWENILSGAGIKKIYRFLGTTKKYPITDSTREIEEHDFNPDRISFFAKRDERCKDTFAWYSMFYARCAKNFALDALTLNGLYIAGGIAAKNSELFSDPAFMAEFTRCGKQSARLRSMPLSLILDYNVSLYGAVVADRLRLEGEL